ncbi:MAG: hypothetical protein EZS28_018475 [Streblomastix strix]|uniref:Uncharacterized protein n=1 Tax=Streblomastix strix TaxID=222440 RepID=A0A5J4VTK7_9EUKA|nr:MAG: hypothetical protein EZS28_018475 [Streblomastix strix]
MIYLNRTLGTIKDCIFSGRNGTYQDFNFLNKFEQVSEEGKDICPNNAQYYSSTSYGVLYISEGDYSISSVILNETKVGGVRVDKGTALLNKISFIEAEIQEGDYYDRSLLLEQCTCNSCIVTKDAIVNRKSEDDYIYIINNVIQKKMKKKNDSSDECKYEIVLDGECEFNISDLWEMREMPNTSLNTANIENECLRYRRTIEVCD